jgi:hypothetical protein
LQLASREIGRPPSGQVEGADGSKRFVRARSDVWGRHAEVLEPESGLVGDPAHHDLVLGILEDRCNDPR